MTNFAWPVSQEDFQQITETLDAIWQQALASVCGEDRDVMLCEYLPGWLIQYVHAAVVRERAKRCNANLIAGPLTMDFYDPAWESIGAAYERELQGKTIRLQARRIARNALLNRHLPLLRRMQGFIKPDAFALGSNDLLRSQYAKFERVAVDNTYINLFAKGRDPVQLSKSLAGTTDDLVIQLSTSLNCQFGPKSEIRELQSALRGRLAVLTSVLRCSRDRADRAPLLVTESVRPLHKSAAFGWSAGGGTAVGFHHGHAVGEFRLPYRAYAEFAAYDEFVCPTQNSAEAFASDYSQTALASLRSVNFIALNSPKNRPTERGRIKEYSPVKPLQIKNVMLMGFPMNGIRYAHHRGTFWASQLELEVRLTRLLLGNGFEVLYKVHPERKQPVTRIMESLGARVIVERLEVVLDQADAFVVKYIGSSTFPAILASDKPVFLLDLESSLWNPRYRDLLSKRCNIISANVDDECRIRFEEQQLITALREKSFSPDYEYVEKFYGM